MRSLVNKRASLSDAGMTLAVVGAAIAIPLSAGAAVADQGGNAALQFCRSIAQYYPGTNITGPCVSYFQSHQSNAAATTSYFCRTVGVPDGYFATQGACVSADRSGS